MKYYFKVAAAAALVVAGTGCNDFLTGGELSRDPNRPSVATNRQLFVAAQTNTWALYGSDLSRIPAMFVQQAQGVGSQYIPIYQYGINEGTTNGQHIAFYSAGGLVDVRKLQQGAAAVQDSLMLGIGQILEGVQMSLAADIFGDLVYTQALSGPNPALDPQATVYAGLMAKLDSGVKNVNTTAPTNVGPEDADLNYGGDPDKWSELAHTIEARILLHQTERSPSLWRAVYDSARKGISTPANDFLARYSGASNESNLLYQFTVEQRPGYIAPDPFAINLIDTRNDPRGDLYFNADRSDFSDQWIAPDQPQVIASYAENELMIAEAAYHLGLTSVAQQALIAERRAAGFSAAAAGYNGSPPTGLNLLREILTERYIALYMQPEAYNDYKRNCFPNLTPTVAGKKIPARLFYDINERQTNTNIPEATAQPTRNTNDPANATDPFGNVCLGQ